MEEERRGTRQLGLTRADAVAYYRRGLKSFEEGDLENAILDLSEAIYNDENFAEYYATRGLFYVEANQPEDARLDLEYALKRNKRLWLAHYALGILAFREDDFEEAFERFNTAVKMRPDRSELLYFRAVVQSKLGNDEAALDDMERAEQLFPPGDKRRKDASTWLKEFKKAALTPMPGDKGGKALPDGKAPGQLPASLRPQLRAGGSRDDEDDE